MSDCEQELDEIWSKGGPRWDALTCVESGTGGVLLVEAKSHVLEIYAGRCKATSSHSLEMIDLSLARAKKWLAGDVAANWMGLHPYWLGTSECAIYGRRVLAGQKEGYGGMRPNDLSDSPLRVKFAKLPSRR
jgi:hypothetical protein